MKTNLFVSPFQNSRPAPGTEEEQLFGYIGYVAIQQLTQYSEAIINIVQCLEDYNTLHLLGLPHYPLGIEENIRSLATISC